MVGLWLWDQDHKGLQVVDEALVHGCRGRAMRGVGLRCGFRGEAMRVLQGWGHSHRVRTLATGARPGRG